MDGYTPEVERVMTRLFDSLGEKDRRRYAAVEAWANTSFQTSYGFRLTGEPIRRSSPLRTATQTPLRRAALGGSGERRSRSPHPGVALARQEVEVRCYSDPSYGSPSPMSWRTEALLMPILLAISRLLTRSRNSLFTSAPCLVIVRGLP
jgi:hypothetical protein